MVRFLSESAPEAFSALDAIARGLGSISFVGSALGVMVSIAEVVLRSLRRVGPLPQPLKMDPAHDEVEVNDALNLLRGGGDWTPLFLPPSGDVGEPQGGWRMTQEEGGFRFGRGDGRGGGFGCAPGDLFFVARGVQARIGTGDVTIPNDSRRPRHSLILRKGQNPDSMRSLVFALGDWFPGLASLGRSVWSMVGTSSSATMFSVDAVALLRGWSAYHESTTRFRAAMDPWLGRKLDNGSKRWKREMIAAYLSNVAAAFHDVRDNDGRPLSRDALLELAMDANRRPVAETVGMQAMRAASSLLRRQHDAAGTVLNALVSKNAPALVSNETLRDHFLAERKRLQAAGRFDAVELSEVPDQGLREQLAKRRQASPAVGGPTSFLDPASAARRRRDREGLGDLSRIAKPPEMTGLGVVSQPDERGGGSMLAATLVAAAGLGGAVYVGTRTRTRKQN